MQMDDMLGAMARQRAHGARWWLVDQPLARWLRLICLLVWLASACTTPTAPPGEADTWTPDAPEACDAPDAECCQSALECDDDDHTTLDVCEEGACQHKADPEACTLPPTSTVVINELMILPSAVNTQYLELHNSTDEAISLDGWHLQVGLWTGA